MTTSIITSASTRLRPHRHDPRTRVNPPRDYDFSAPVEPRFSLKIGAFRDRVDAAVLRDATGGLPGFEFDLEDVIGVTDDKTVLQLDTDVDVSMFQAGYSYSLIRDTQKELSIMAGVHFADFEVRLASSGGLQTERSNGETPLSRGGVDQPWRRLQLLRDGADVVGEQREQLRQDPASRTYGICDGWLLIRTGI